MTPKPDERSSLVDPRVADAWREASSEEPSGSVDDAILAAARREVSARPETLAVWEAREAREARRRWWPLAAAATVAAVAVGVLQLTPTDKLVNPTTETATVSDVPAPAAKPNLEPPSRPSSAPALAGRPAPASTPTPRPAEKAVAERAPIPSQPKEQKRARSDEPRTQGEAQRTPSQPEAAQGAPTPDPFPEAKKTASDTGAAVGGQVASAPPSPVAPVAPMPARSETAANVARESGPLAKMAAAPAPDGGVADAREKARKPLPVADWIALIRRLRTEGKTDEAAKELAAFRATHSDHEKLLPPDLRDWRPPEK